MAGHPGGSMPGRTIGKYAPEARAALLQKFHEKRRNRRKPNTIVYNVRKRLADGRARIKGRFVAEHSNSSSEAV